MIFGRNCFAPCRLEAFALKRIASEYVAGRIAVSRLSGTSRLALFDEVRFDTETRNSLSLGTAFTVRAGDDDHITIGIAEPNLQVSGCRIEVWFFDDLGSHPTSTLHGHIKVVDLEPQQDTVARRRRICIDEIGVIFRVPCVELENQPTGTRDPIVHLAVLVFWKRICSNQFSVPTAARPHIAHRYEGLGLDR